jgi:UDP-2,3-diacylglucosamine pyrophosphatase LpxH
MAFVDYVNKVHSEIASNLIKIDNENRCSWAEGKRKKKEGKRKGASDYFLAHPVRKTYKDNQDGSLHEYVVCGMWHELKTEKGKETLEQRMFGDRMIKSGYEYKCSHSIDEAIANLELYLK